MPNSELLCQVAIALLLEVASESLRGKTQMISESLVQFPERCRRGDEKWLDVLALGRKLRGDDTDLQKAFFDFDDGGLLKEC